MRLPRILIMRFKVRSNHPITYTVASTIVRQLHPVDCNTIQARPVLHGRFL